MGKSSSATGPTRYNSMTLCAPSHDGPIQLAQFVSSHVPQPVRSGPFPFPRRRGDPGVQSMGVRRDVVQVETWLAPDRCPCGKRPPNTLHRTHRQNTVTSVSPKKEIVPHAEQLWRPVAVPRSMPSSSTRCHVLSDGDGRPTRRIKGWLRDGGMPMNVGEQGGVPWSF